jgi:integrase
MEHRDNGLPFWPLAGATAHASSHIAKRPRDREVVRRADARLKHTTPAMLVFDRAGKPWVPNTLKTVSNALGHSTISTTADIYSHVTDSLMRDAANKIDGLLRKVAND